MNENFSPRDDAGSALSEEECRSLLRSRTLGRVALVSGALPVIVPVEYVYDEASVTFSAAHDVKLRGAAEGDVLAFEVDTYDPVSGDVSSVHVLGRTSLFRHEHETDMTGRRDSVRLQCEIVTGRRVRSAVV